MSWRPMVVGYTPLDPTNRKKTLKAKYNLGTRDSSGRGPSPQILDSNFGPNTHRAAKELSEVDFSTISQELARNLPLKIHQKRQEDQQNQSSSTDATPRTSQNQSESDIPRLNLSSLNPTPKPIKGVTPKTAGLPKQRQRGNSLIFQRKSVLTKLNRKEKDLPLNTPVYVSDQSDTESVLPNSDTDTEEVVVPTINVREATYEQIDIEGRLISLPEYQDSLNTEGFNIVSTDSRYVLEDDPDIPVEGEKEHKEPKKIALHLRKEAKDRHNRVKKLSNVISDDSDQEVYSGVPKIRNRHQIQRLDVPYDEERYVDVRRVENSPVKPTRRRPKKQSVNSLRQDLHSEPIGNQRNYLKDRLVNGHRGHQKLIPVGYDTQSDLDNDRTLSDDLRSRVGKVHKWYKKLSPVGHNTKVDFDNRVESAHRHQRQNQLYYSDLIRKPNYYRPNKPLRPIQQIKPRKTVRVVVNENQADTSDQESLALSRPPKYPNRRSRKHSQDTRQPPIPQKLFDEYGHEYIVHRTEQHAFNPSDLNDHVTSTYKGHTYKRAGTVHSSDLPSDPVHIGKDHKIPAAPPGTYLLDTGNDKIYVVDESSHHSKGTREKYENARANFERRLNKHITDQHHKPRHRRNTDSNSLHDHKNRMDDYDHHTEISPFALEKLSAKKFFKDMGRLPDDRDSGHHHRRDSSHKDYNARGPRAPPLPLPRRFSDDGGRATAGSESFSRSYSRNTYNAPLDKSESIAEDTYIDPKKNQIHIYSYGPLNINSGASMPKGDVNESVPENPNEKGTSTDDVNQKPGTGHFLAQGQGRDGFRYVNEDLNSSGYGTTDTPQNYPTRTDLPWRKDNSSASSRRSMYVMKTPLVDRNRPPTQRSMTTKQVQTVSSATKEIQTEPEKLVADSETQKYAPGSLEDIKQKVREIWQELAPKKVEEEEADEDKEELDEMDMYFDPDEDVQYVMSLVTEDGDVIGPFSFEIDDVQIGFGKMLLEKHPELMMASDTEEKKDGQEKDEKADQEKTDESKEGLRNRISSPNDMNEFSSRSHTMLQLMIDNEIPDPDDENLYITKHGKLTFVDLAGSEKAKDSTITTGEFLAETNNINKSLLVLGNCISALADSKKRGGHIPYRDSKLTKLLADSIGGSGVTLMIACVSPSNQNTAETMNTLRYANRAKKIRNKPIVKMDPREKLILTLKRELKILRQENHYLRQQLNFPEKPRGKLQKENDEQFLKLMKQNAKKTKDKDGDKELKSDDDLDKIPVASSILPPAKTLPSTDSTLPSSSDGPPDSGKPPTNVAEGGGLYEMLQEYMVENETLRSENQDLQHFKDRTRRDQQNLSHENERLQRRLEEIERLLSAEMPNRFGSVDPQYPYSDPNVTRGRQGSYGDLPPVDHRGGAPNGFPSNSPPGSQSRTRQRPQQHLPMKPPHHLNEPVTPRGNASYPGQSYTEKFQQRMEHRDSQGGYGSPPQGRGPPSGPPSGYYGGYSDQNGPRYGSQSNSRRGSGGLYDDQDPVPTPRRKPGPTPDPIPRKSSTTSSQQINPQGGTDEILNANDRLREELSSINSEIRRNKGLNELSRQIYYDS